MVSTVTASFTLELFRTFTGSSEGDSYEGGRELEDLKAKRANDGPVDDFTIEDLQERIHGLTLAYYWMKRQHPRVCNDQMRKHINKYSLPHEPQLKLQET